MNPTNLKPSEHTTAVLAAGALSLEGMKRADIPAIFDGFKAQLDALVATATTLTVTDASQTTSIKLAHTTRMALRGIRLDIEKKRKELTDYHLKTKQHIDQCAKWLKDQIEPLEARLEDQEKFVAREEEKRRAALRYDRAMKLTPFGVDTTLYALADMDEAAFKTLLEASAFAHEQRQHQAAEAAAEQQRIREENDRLRKEAAARELEQYKERNRRDAELAEERRKREATEHELQAAKDKEAATIAAEQEAKQKAAQAPDREKLYQFAATIRSLQLPEASTTNGAGVFKFVAGHVSSFADQIESWSSSL